MSTVNHSKPALVLLLICLSSLLVVSCKEPERPVETKVFYNLNYQNLNIEINKFLKDNNILSDDIVSVSNSGAFVPGQGIYHTFLLVYKK